VGEAVGGIWEEVGVGEGGTVPLGAMVVVGTAVFAAVEVLVAVAVLVGRRLGVSVLVAEDVGTAVGGGAWIVSEPALVLIGTLDPAGDEAAALPSGRAIVPGAEPALISKKTLTNVPSGIAVWFNPNTMTRTVPEEGVELDTDFSALVAAGPAETWSKVRREASNERSKFKPETSTPLAESMEIGIVTVSPGSPEALPAESWTPPLAWIPRGFQSSALNTRTNADCFTGPGSSPDCSLWSVRRDHRLSPPATRPTPGSRCFGHRGCRVDRRR
jgi:hypothetical protein